VNEDNVHAVSNKWKNEADIRIKNARSGM